MWILTKYKINLFDHVEIVDSRGFDSKKDLIEYLAVSVIEAIDMSFGDDFD